MSGTKGKTPNPAIDLFGRVRWQHAGVAVNLIVDETKVERIHAIEALRLFIHDHRVQARHADSHEIVTGRLPKTVVYSLQMKLNPTDLEILEFLEVDIFQLREVLAGIIEGENVGGKMPKAKQPVPAYVEASVALPQTGAPGRPSSMHIATQEAKRRRETGQTEKRVTDEAKYLKLWFDKNYVGLPRLTSKTIENNIRADHNAWRYKNP